MTGRERHTGRRWVSPAGSSEANFYVRKKKYGELRNAKGLRQLRGESARLTTVVANLTLNKHILGEVVREEL